MIKDILPEALAELILAQYSFAGIYELRIRTDKPIYINYFGDFLPLRGENQSIVYADRKLIGFIIARVTERSVYRYNTEIKQGFITMPSGMRIGIAGEVVNSDDGGIKTIKNLSSIVVRVPHEIKNCSSEILPYIVDSMGVRNTLILSPPGCGKTTIIRDIARQLGLQEKMYNVLVVDERYEIACAEDGVPRMDVGLTTDVLSGGGKLFAFGSGIRSLRPDVIITDEIGIKSDAMAIRQAALSGVKVIATVHARSEAELTKRSGFENLFKEHLFERVVVLSDRNGVGTIEAILNADFQPLV